MEGKTILETVSILETEFRAFSESFIAFVTHLKHYWIPGISLVSPILPLAGAVLALLSLGADLPVQGEDARDGLQGGKAVKNRNISSTESIPIPSSK